ncbi:MAG: hypothetical protein QM813_04080 [Verrucomicrobiota bacterium]
MRQWIVIGCFCMIASLGFAASLTNAPACIELPDQFEKPQKLSFPNTNITVLTLADRKGSDQIAGWVEPVAKQFGTRVDVRGIADVSAVPRLLRGTVRSAFRKEQSYPVMMDWSGKEVAKFAPKENVTTVLLIDGQGKILRRYEGAAKKPEVEELCKVIQEMLPRQEAKVAAKP